MVAKEISFLLQFFFPAHLPTSRVLSLVKPRREEEKKEENQKREAEKASSSTCSQVRSYDTSCRSAQLNLVLSLQETSKKSSDYGTLIREFPSAIGALLRNATFMLICVGAALDGFLLAGMAAFLPKYFESQFSLPPGDAAMLVGAIVVPAGAGGTLVGGYVSKRFRLNRAGLIKLYILCQFIVLPLYLGFLVHCPSADFAGVTIPYPEAALGSGLERPDLGSACNAGCAGGCAGAADFDPVCASVDGRDVTFFNPCYAGCESAANATKFLDCGCAESLFGEAGERWTATRGICESAKYGKATLISQYLTDFNFPFRCDYTYFSVFLFLQIFFTFVATMPALMSGLRYVLNANLLSLSLPTYSRCRSRKVDFFRTSFSLAKFAEDITKVFRFFAFPRSSSGQKKVEKLSLSFFENLAPPLQLSICADGRLTGEGGGEGRDVLRMQNGGSERRLPGAFLASSSFLNSVPNLGVAKSAS